LIAAALIVSAHGQNGGDKPESKSSENKKAATTSGVYRASFDRVDISLNLPAASTDPTVEATKAHVSKADSISNTTTGPYIIASFNVKNGSSQPTLCKMFSFSLTFENVNQVDGKQAFILVGDVDQKIPPGDESGLNNEGVDLYNNLIEPTDLMPGANRTVYCVFHIGDLTGLKKVFVSNAAVMGSSKEMKKE